MEMQGIAEVLVSKKVCGGSTFEPLRAVVLELDSTLFDPLAYDHSGLMAAATFASKKFSMDFGKLIALCRQRLLAYGTVDQAFFADALSELGEDQSLAAEIYDSFLTHEPEMSCHSGILPMVEMLGRRYKLGLMTEGPGEVAERKIRSLGLESRFDAIYLWPRGANYWSRVPALRWFEESLRASADQIAYVAWKNSLGFGEAHSLDWHTMAVGCASPCQLPSFARWAVANPLEVEGLANDLAAAKRDALPASLSVWQNAFNN